MNRLIKIFSKYHILILFIFLQTLSVAFIFQGKNYHRSLFINSVNDVTGNALSAITNYQRYFQLQEDNELLSQQNAELLGVTPSAVQKLNDEYLMMDDSLYRQKYVYRKAKVISSSIYHKNNVVMIDLGENDGVTEEMGIITAQGVVGMVVKTSEHYAKAISFLHEDTRISCKIKRNDASGILYWEGKDHTKALLLDLPLTTKVFKGDTVMTSGYSSIYPKGIQMGIVEAVSANQATQMLDISVGLSLDYNSLNHVYVVESLDKEEIKKLAEED